MRSEFTTWIAGLTDDDGSGTVGDIVNKAFFNTQMHERYWHASLLFLASYAFLSRNYWPFALVSVAYFLNLEATLHFLDLHNYKVLIFNSRFVAGIFALAIVLAFSSLYRLARTSRPVAGPA